MYERKYMLIGIPLAIIGGILCFLPFIAKQTGLALLNYFAQTPSIIIPLSLKIATAGFFVISTVISAYAGYLRTKKGGTRSEDDPIIHLKQGPYAIMRHPSDFIFGLILPAFTIIASDQVPFTLYSIVGNILYFMLIHYTTVGEEELNILKWGDAYRQYQKEVPRFNFVLGLWRLYRRREK